jgi:uncharacterized surface protein with fasciclin (FAS1) repeats
VGKKNLFVKIHGKIKKSYLILSIIGGVVLLLLGVFWFLGDPALEIYEGTGMHRAWDIADNLNASPIDKTFASYIDNLGYNTFLHDDGPYTVFVPSEQAYAAMQKDTRDYLLAKDHIGDLRQALLYHIVKGAYTYKDLQTGGQVQTLEGEPLVFTQKNGNVLINNYAAIQTYDIYVKNGIIHVISNYLIPPSEVQ